MKVVIGNANAIEAYQEPGGEMMFRQVSGERETTFYIPEGTGTMAALQTVLVGMSRMMAPDSRPWWIESDDLTLATLLVEHYGLPPTATVRPQAWSDGSTTAPRDDPAPKKKKVES